MAFYLLNEEVNNVKILSPQQDNYNRLDVK
jgi:hypothetical protein